MKKTIFILFTVISVCSYAQERFPVDNAESMINPQSFQQNGIYDNPKNDYIPLVQEGKVWSVLDIVDYGNIENAQFTTTQMAFFGDTIIGDIQYKKMYASNEEYPVFPQDWWLQNFMREDEDKKVWYKDKNLSSKEKLHYDFSLEINDTVPDDIGYSYEPVIVKDITYMTMRNGQQCKVWHLSSFCSGFYGAHYEIWIEGIGSSLGVLEPITGMLMGGCTRLLCVHENEKLIFDENFYSPGTCYKGNSNKINAYNNQINIYPNPVKNIINIKNIENIDISAILLINMQGQIVRSYNPSATQLDVSDITKGIYFIKLAYSKGDVIKKIIINK